MLRSSRPPPRSSGTFGSTYQKRLAVSRKQSLKLARELDPPPDDENSFYGLWDFDNCRLPPLYVVGSLIPKINLCLQTVNPLYRMCRMNSAIGNPNFAFIWQNRDVLNKQWDVKESKKRKIRCSVPICGRLIQSSNNAEVAYERKYDVADRMLIQELLCYVLANRTPRNILIISDDCDFGFPMHILRERGYRVFLMQRSANLRPLTQIAQHAWAWVDVVNGLTRPFYSLPNA
ncbi:hypothetical protein Bca4012_097467 [Brassica carinata]|uniref:BnaCnng51710D protein n=3 Tax=Brassica TaxID=3705 RepID=A0A078JJK5_BRANA|nr:uncharacterized protein LOC111210301 [Brassica napus]XP_048617169.1 uncharacterized protein LOC125589049 [Brassica napus]XP_048626929.1 uncharacterized protein LOC125594982 [Brassica napus]XP_048630671.1 uncharacterized protein LOC111200033 [Brassica napus]KAG2250131.1 hypothetical protein Bca52824_080267 [Brassica carinata]KAG2250134.1 hypothetical protein Bca52824_080270 [Brassica carinata]KAH0849001.1 hypothetical protein HID58_091604 [Brassica napus]KAH0852747.1 hypothetical protein H